MAGVSVVMPTFNGAAFVQEALASVFRQSLLPEEIIVVDDCSRDATCEIVRRLARTSPVRLHLHCRRQNSGGPARPINEGIAAASGEFIAVLDQDDVFTPEKLEEQLASLVADDSLGFVFSLCGRHDDRSQLAAPAPALKALRVAASATPDSTFDGEAFLRLLLARGNFLIGYPAVLFRRSLWQGAGGVDESLVIASDYDFFCQLCLQGRVAFLDRVHYLRRVHAANLCGRLEEMRLEACRVRARYQVLEPWVLDDAGVARVLRESLFDLAYMLRQRGAYRDALRQHWRSLCTWGWDGRTLTAMLKLLPHWALGL
jgi:succinoglycan biosynthesis protein ExoO